MAHYNVIFGIISCILGLIFWIRLPRGTLAGYFAGLKHARESLVVPSTSPSTQHASTLAIYLWAVFAVATNLGITTLLGKLFPGLNPPDSPELENIGKDLLGKLIVFPLVLILVPICEEILFRGLLVDGFISQKLRPQFAIFFSALLFSLGHGPNQILGAFAFAIGLSQIRKLNLGSLRANFLVHALNNTFGLYMLFSHAPPLSLLCGAWLSVIGVLSGGFSSQLADK